MTAKQLTRIAIALGVVLFLWGLAELLGGRRDGPEHVAGIQRVSMAAADSVELRRSEDTLRFVKAESGAWTVNGHAAEESMVQDIFRTFSDSLQAELRARSPSSHARMGVDSAGGKRLRIVAGDRTLVDLWVGQRGSVWETVFVRPVGDDRVYALGGPLASQVDRAVNDWRDKRIATVEPDSVRRIVVERGRRRYALERGDNGWRFAAGGAVDSAAAARLLTAFRSLTAQGSAFATDEEAASADFARPERRITLVGVSGDTLAALAFDSVATGFWVRRAAGGPVFHLFQWKVDELVPTDSALSAPRRSSQSGSP